MQNIQIIESGRKLLKALANRDNVSVVFSNKTMGNGELLTLYYNPETGSHVVECSPQTVYNSKAWMMQLFNTATLIHEKAEPFFVDIKDPDEHFIYRVLLGNKLFKEVSGFAGVDQAVAEILIESYNKLVENGKSLVGDLVAWDIENRRADGHPIYSKVMVHDYSETLPENLSELVDQAKDHTDLRKIVQMLLKNNNDSHSSDPNRDSDDSDNTSDSGDNTSDSGDNASDSGDNTSDSGDNASDSGDNASDSGDNASDSGDNTSDSGDNTSDSGDNTSDSGDNTSDSGDNQSGTTGNTEENPSDGTGSSTSNDMEGSIPAVGSPINKGIINTIYPRINKSSPGHLNYSAQNVAMEYMRSYKPSPNPTFVMPSEYMEDGHNDMFMKDVQDFIDKSKLSNRIRKKLLALKVTNWSSQYKTGRIDTRRLHKLITTNDPKVFKRREEPLIDTNTAVQLVVDYSGSMLASQKIEMATAAAYQMGRVLQQLQISYEIIGFTDVSTRMPMYVIKEFSEQVKLPILLKRMCSWYITSSMASNSDGDTLVEVYPRLASRPEAKKIMIVLSDGAPAGNYTGDGRAYLKTVIKQIESSGEVDIYGIGIKSDLVKRFYTKCVVIDNIETLDSELLLLINDKIIRGNK